LEACVAIHAGDLARVITMSEEQLADTVTNEERDGARKVLDYARAEIERLASGDLDRVFAIRRYIWKRLQEEDRGPRSNRVKLRSVLHERQHGLCAFGADCLQGGSIEQSGTDIHRVGHKGRYLAETTVLVHRKCHTAFDLRTRSNAP
jgi:hypothetical protein